MKTQRPLNLSLRDRLAIFAAIGRVDHEQTRAMKAADDVVKARRENWPHLSQEVPRSQARYLPRFCKGGGQREVGV